MTVVLMGRTKGYCLAGSWVVKVVVLLENTKADQKVAYWVASKEPQKVAMTAVTLAEMMAP